MYILIILLILGLTVLLLVGDITYAVDKEEDVYSKPVSLTAHFNKRTRTSLPAAKARGCPPKDDIWMKLIQLSTPDATVFVDIGSNKGYTGVKFLELWYGAKTPITTLSLRNAIMSKKSPKSHRECGACSDCRYTEKPILEPYSRLCHDKGAMKTSEASNAKELRKAIKSTCSSIIQHKKNIHVYSYDGSFELVNSLGSILKSFKLKDTWSVQLAAFTDECPSDFISFKSNGELGVIDTVDGKEMVPCKTVDSLKFNHIDILKIDTEGFDMNVIKGSTSYLESGKVGVIMFEFNVMWENHNYNLNDAIEYLAYYSYRCFLEGKNYLVDLDPLLWDQLSFAKKRWSNVYCMKKSHPVYPLFKAHSVQTLFS